MRAEVVDLFCGIGGLSAGFQREGFDVVAGVDSDASCKYPYEKNIEAKFLLRDVSALSAEEVSKLYSDFGAKILIGCAPCQSFSGYTKRYRWNCEGGRPDTRWKLLEEFGRLIEEVQPDVVSMENVTRVLVHPVFARFTETLERARYHVTYYKVRADHYGVPQRRARLVLFASRYGKVKLIEPTHRENPMTVRDAIGSLPSIKAGTAHHEDRLHRSRGLGETNLRRLRATSEGGSWKDWDEHLKLDCHKRLTGKTFRSVYGRMKWDEPAPVITTQCLGIGNGRFGHPEQDRAISIREAALLQSFPPNYAFLAPEDDVSGVRLARHIGNAVPVRLAEAVARSIRCHLDGSSVAA
jgi:DNA (cytosine-5)-methyltransferase 1